jgi:hypothetical protein
MLYFAAFRMKMSLILHEINQPFIGLALFLKRERGLES